MTKEYLTYEQCIRLAELRGEVISEQRKTVKFGLPENEKDQAILALKTDIATLEGMVKGLRTRTDKQAEQITHLLRKIERLEEENANLEVEVMEVMGERDSYGGTD
jgi:predicted RNase H-like nuclease (RuvC/YqgF family)